MLLFTLELNSFDLEIMTINLHRHDRRNYDWHTLWLEYHNSRLKEGNSMMSASILLKLRHLWSDLTVSYWKRVPYMQQSGPCCSTPQKHGRWEQKTCKASVVWTPLPRGVGRIWWVHSVSNSEVTRKVLGPRIQQSQHVINASRLNWLWRVLRMSIERLTHRALLCEVGCS